MKNKRIIASMAMLLLIATSLSAAFVLEPSRPSTSPFKSPALIGRMEKDTDIGWNIQTGSDINTLQFLADPVASMQKIAKYVADELAAVDDIDFWNEHEALASIFKEIDPENFPDTNKGEYSVKQLNLYFKNNFLSDSYGDVNRALAANKIIISSPDILPYDAHELLGGNLELATKLYGTHIGNGFGWDWNVGIGYHGQESYLDKGNSRLGIDASMTADYTFKVFSPTFTIGIAATPMMTIDNLQTGSSFVSSRITDNPLTLFSNPLRLGLGVKIDMGVMFEPKDNLAFTLDLRNLPTFRSYFEWQLTDIADGKFNPELNRNIYYEAPDIAIRSIYETDAITFGVEVSNILNQVIWMNELENYEFNFFQTVDMTFDYAFSDTLSLLTELGHEELMVGVRWNDLTAKITTKLDRGYLGLTFGYEW